MGFKELSKAVIEQAEYDASQKQENYEKRQAINFLCATTKGYRERFDMFCTLAGKVTEDEIEKNRQKYRRDLCKNKSCFYLNQMKHTHY